MAGDGEWRVPSASELRHGQFIAVRPLGVPRWLDRLDALTGTVAGALILIGTIGAPVSDVSGQAAARLLLGALAVTVIAVSARLGVTGLEVSPDNLRVRRLWKTVVHQWSDIASVDVVRGPHVYAERWDVLRVSAKGATPTWVLEIRRPRDGKGSRFVDGRTRASYASVDGVVRDVLRLRDALSRES